MKVRLRPLTEEDRELTHRIEGSEEMMHHMGGPRTPEQIDAIHTRRLQLMADDEAWMYTIMPDGSDEPLGNIGAWKHQRESDGVDVYEMGWMILPENQGKGIATQAGTLLLEMLRERRKYPEVHAYPNVENAASNAICRKLGFGLLGDFQFEFAGRPLHCNDWVLEL